MCPLLAAELTSGHVPENVMGYSVALELAIASRADCWGEPERGPDITFLALGLSSQGCHFTDAVTNQSRRGCTA